jgi:hypothetical protein
MRVLRDEGQRWSGKDPWSSSLDTVFLYSTLDLASTRTRDHAAFGSIQIRLAMRPVTRSRRYEKKRARSE